jgi:hypothetical protein
VSLRFRSAAEDGEFTRYIKTGLINPGYKLLIIVKKSNIDYDVTDTLLTVFDYLETKQYEITAHTHRQRL